MTPPGPVTLGGIIDRSNRTCIAPRWLGAPVLCGTQIPFEARLDKRTCSDNCRKTLSRSRNYKPERPRRLERRIEYHRRAVADHQQTVVDLEAELVELDAAA